MPFRVLGLVLLPAAASMLFGAEIGRRHAPAIFLGGVVNGASFRPAPDNFVTANSIISIFGDDLSLQTRVVLSTRLAEVFLTVRCPYEPESC